MENQSPPPTTADADDVVMKESLINTFCEITSASPSEALFYLESHNFNLESAISTFLETTNPAAVSSAAAAATAIPNNALSHSPTQSGSYSPSQSQSSTPSRSRSPSPPPAHRAEYNLRSSSSASKPPEGGNGGRRAAGGIRTLADLNRPRPGGDGADSDSDDDEPQEYYTGGEKSGMLVQDPSKSNDVDAIFDQARRAGAVERPAELLQPSSSSRSFTGTGRLLSGETVSRAPQPPEVVAHNITFWRNGFTIGDGPLRRFEDPENASFLESIRRSDCPKELKPANMGTKVHVNLIRKDENYTAQERPPLPFLGVGRTLGGTSDVTPTEPIAVASTPTVAAPPPSVGVVVDQTLPSTSIQLRLADGTRMVSRFNYHHTLRDIRRFIDASRPGGAVSYQLQTVGFPPKQLTDLDQTIEQAGLANSVVLQKLS